MFRFRSKLMLFSLLVVILIFLIFVYSNENSLQNRIEKIVNNENNVLVKQAENPAPLQPSTTAKTPTTTTEKIIKFDYLKKYPFLLDCKNPNLPKWTKITPSDSSYDNLKPAPNETHSLEILRGILLYFPFESTSHFAPEFKWLYRTWLEMLKFESPKWRTDLIVFVEKDDNYFKNAGSFFAELNCTFENRRKSASEKPKCILIEFLPLKKRANKIVAINPVKSQELLLSNFNVFDTNESNVVQFVSYLYPYLKDYGYTDSILMAFDGYEYFKEAGYDFLMRSDMDVFFSPFAGQWMPKYCNDFIVGSGGFSDDFNKKRLNRVADDLGFESAGLRNLGSTWYSTPTQFRLVSYLTLFSMSYLAQNEFSQPEREGKVGGILWPYWHYGVLLLYGQSIGLNHLIATNQINVLKLERHIDYGSGNVESIMDKIHIHVYHGETLFSKSQFKVGNYDKMNVSDEDSLKVKFYCLKMALESKNTTNMFQLYLNEANKKN